MQYFVISVRKEQLVLLIIGILKPTTRAICSYTQFDQFCMINIFATYRKLSVWTRHINYKVAIILMSSIDPI